MKMYIYHIYQIIKTKTNFSGTLKTAFIISNAIFYFWSENKYFSQTFYFHRNNAILLCSDGKVKNWGWCQISGCSNNLTGACLNNNYIYVSTPQYVNDLNGTFIQVANHDETFGVLRNDGRLFLWGDNSSGQLGNGGTVNTCTPQILSSLNNIKQFGFNKDIPDLFYPSYPFTYAIRNDGTLWMWGNNTYGQLGIGNKISQTTPTQVTGINNVKKVACGNRHCIALKNDGTVWGWGANDSLQLGITGYTEVLTPIQLPFNNIIDIDATHRSSALVRNDGKVIVFGSTFFPGSNLPRTLNYINNVKKVSLGLDHILLLKNDGNVFVIGKNLFGQYGNGTNNYNYGDTTEHQSSIGNVVDILASNNANAALMNDGTLWVWGYHNGNIYVWGNCSYPTYAPCLIPAGCNLAISVNEIEKSWRCEIYPNPSNKEFVIRGLPINKLKQIKIFNISGEEIAYKQSIVNNTDVLIEIMSEAGVYFFQLITEDGIYMHKIIKINN